MADTKSLTINDLSSVTMEIQVKVARQFYIRCWIGLRLIWLATRIMGCGLQISDEIEVSDG